MAELRFDVHTNVEEVSQRYSRATERMIRQAERLTGAQEKVARVLDMPSRGGAGGAAARQAQSVERQARSTQKLSRAQESQLRVEERASRAKQAALRVEEQKLRLDQQAARALQDELRLDQQQIRLEQQKAKATQQSAQSERQAARSAQEHERQQRRQLNTGLTLLSTLGDEHRAFAQLQRAEIRAAEATGQHVDVQRRLAAVQDRVRGAGGRMSQVFSTQAVQSRDLRRNMLGLNQAMQRLQQGSILLLGPLSGVGARIQTISQAASQGGVAAVAFAAALAGGAGLVFAAIQTARSLDELQKRADRLGVTFEELQELQFVGARQGVQNINKALDVFVKRIGEASQGGGEAQQAIESLGLSLDDLVGRAPLDQLELVADRFAEVESAAQRNAIAADLFSRANQDMAQALVLGAEGLSELRERARDLGIVLEEDAGRQSEVTVDRLTELGFIARQAGRQIVSDLLPAIERVSEEAIEGAVAFANFIESLSVPLEQRSLASINNEIERMEGRLEALQDGLRGFLVFQGVGGIAAAILEATTGQDIVFELDEITERLEELRRVRDRLIREEPQRNLADALGITPEAFREAKREVQSITDATRSVAEQIDELEQNIANLREQRAAFESGGAPALGRARAEQEARGIVGELVTQADRQQVARELELVEAGERRTVTEQELIEALTERLVVQARLEKSVSSLGEAEAEGASAAEKRAQSEAEARLALDQTAASLGQKAADLREEIEATREGEEALAALTRERFVEQQILEAMPQLLELSGEARAREVERIRQQAEEVAKLQQELAQAQQEAREEARKTTRDLDAQATQRERLLAQPFENAIEGAQRAFRDSFRSIFDEGIEGFSDFGDRVLDLMKDLAAEIAALLVFKPILDQSGLQGVLGGQGQGAGLLGGGGQGSLGQVGQLLSGLGRLVGLGGGQGVTIVASAPSTQAAIQQGLLNPALNPNAPVGLGQQILGSISLGSVLGLGTGGLAAFNLSRGGFGVTESGSSTGGDIGTAIGALAGGIVGSIVPGAGTAAGAFVGGVTGGAYLSAVEAILRGENPFAAGPGTNDVTAALRGGVIGAKGGLAAGGLAASLGLVGGPLGLLAGAILGALLGGAAGIFSSGVNKSTIRITGQEEALATGRPTFETPFGVFGLRSKNIGFGETVRSLDEQIAPLLTDAEVAAAGENLQTRSALEREFASFDNEAIELVIDRVDGILSAITPEMEKVVTTHAPQGVSTLTARLIEESDLTRFGDEDFRRITEAFLPRVQEFLAERAALRARVTAFAEAPLEELGQALEPATDVEKAIRDVSEAFVELTAKAEELEFKEDFFDQIEKGQERAFELLLRNFEEGIELSALEITDPFAAASRKLAEQQERRLDDAERLGADIAEVERLNLLEREALVEQFYGRANETIRGFLRELEQGPQSPLAPEVQLEAAEGRFQELAQAAQRGDLEARGDLTQAASTLLQASEAVFASSEQFQQRFEFVTRLLENVLATEPNPDALPGFQHGGQFTIGGAGGIDSQVVAFRGTPGERVTVEPPGAAGESRLEQLLEDLGQETAGGTGELSDLLAALLSEFRASRKEVEGLRRELRSDRLRKSA